MVCIFSRRRYVPGMGPAPQHSDGRRDIFALRALWIGLALFGVALWAILVASSLPHNRQAFDTRSYDQAAKLAPASSPRGLGAKLDEARPRQDTAPGHHPVTTLSVFQSGGAPVFSQAAHWVSVAAEGAQADVHYYSATGPPGYQPS